MASEFRWIRSSYSSGENGTCLECSSDGAAVWVRDSKDAGPQFEVSLESWRAFLLGMIQG